MAIAEILHASVAAYVQLYFDQLGGADNSHDEHSVMLEACRAGDAKRAKKLLDEHLRSAATSLGDFLQGHNETDD